MSCTTNELMQWAMDLAGQGETPPDSTIYVPGQQIQRVLFGIDVSSADLQLGRTLGVDAVISHHPVDGLNTAIFERHVALMRAAGVPETRARQAVESLYERWGDSNHSGNYDHVVSVARILNMPFLNIHNPLDEFGRQRMADAVGSVRPDDRLSDVIAALMSIAEIRNAPVRPVVAVGSPGDRAGRVVVVHGAGTNGGYDVANAYFDHGVDTVVYIHLSTDAKLRLRAENKGHVIVVGHLPGDLTGIQPYVEHLRERGLEVVGFSGIR